MSSRSPSWIGRGGELLLLAALLWSLEERTRPTARAEARHAPRHAPRAPRSSAPAPPEAAPEPSAEPSPEPEAALEPEEAAERPPPAQVEVFAPGADGVKVEGCDAGLLMEGQLGVRQPFRLSEGRASLLVDPGECRFTALRRDGRLRALSEPVELSLEPGELAEVELFVPEERIGGLGAQIMEVEDGIEVVRVIAGSPAEKMGLEAGDLIVEVDGLDTTALSADDFIRVMTGPVGSEVDFVLAYEGDTGLLFEPLTLTRATIE